MNITSVGDMFHYQYDFKNDKLVNCNDKEDVVDIEAIIDSSAKTIFKVNGEETYISECALDMLIDDIEKKENDEISIIPSAHIPYRADRNEIGIASGESFTLGNGRKLVFLDSHIELQGNDRNSQSLYNYYLKMKEGLEKLFYAGKNDWLQGKIFSLDINEAFDFLQSLGIDTAKTFRLNGSVYEVSDKDIAEKRYENKQVSRKSYYASLHALDLWNQQMGMTELRYEHLFTYKHQKTDKIKA